jgi:hypothetical protein
LTVATLSPEKCCLFSVQSRSLLELNQVRTQWIPGATSLEIQRPGREAEH